MLNMIFSSIPDHRVTGRCTYLLSDLLTIALLTYLCGGEDYVDMSEFANERARDFGLLEGCLSSPSPDTFERLMSAVEPSEIERCLKEYGRKFLDTLSEKQVVLDGKKLRGVSPKSHGTCGDYLLNAFVSENQLFVGHVRLKDKENEITAIPQLLDKIDVEDAVVSIDAIGTQRSIVDKIIEKKGHYFLGVKDNQPALKEVVEDAFLFHRVLHIYLIKQLRSIEDEEILSRWNGLKTIVEITSTVDYGDRTAVTKRYYISDEDYPQAAYYNMLARGHWAIENNLHWMLDVTFKEDASRARKGFAAENLSLVRKMALQVVKQHNDKRSIKKRLFRAALSQDYLKEILLNAKL